MTVRKSSDRGGDFKRVRACRSARQTGLRGRVQHLPHAPRAGRVLRAARAASSCPGPNAAELEVLWTNPAARQAAGGEAAARVLPLPRAGGGVRPILIAGAQRRQTGASLALRSRTSLETARPVPRLDRDGGSALANLNDDVNRAGQPGPVGGAVVGGVPGAPPAEGMMLSCWVGGLVGSSGGMRPGRRRRGCGRAPRRANYAGWAGVKVTRPWVLRGAGRRGGGARRAGLVTGWSKKLGPTLVTVFLDPSGEGDVGVSIDPPRGRRMAIRGRSEAERGN